MNILQKGIQVFKDFFAFDPHSSPIRNGSIGRISVACMGGLSGGLGN